FPISVYRAEVLDDLVGNRHRSAESPCTPDDLGGPLDQRRHMQHLVWARTDRDQAVVGDQRRRAALQRLHRVGADVGRARRSILGAPNLPAAVDRELVDGGRDRVGGGGGHGGPHRGAGAGMGWWATAKMVAHTGWLWITLPMSSNA